MSRSPHNALSYDSGEIQKFAALASEWWNPEGKFRPLHRLNPIRLSFVRDLAATRFGRNARSVGCFEGLSLLDVGCGGGILAEPMARMGFRVTGIDPAEQNIDVARTHADEASLPITYRCAVVEDFQDGTSNFDVVVCMEVVEHVADLRAFLRAASRLVAPGGLMFVATINRTLKSLVLAKVMAEYILSWIPVGTHDWNRFIEPPTLRRMLEESGLNPLKTQGMAFNLLSWEWQLSEDVDVNYLVAAGR
jgi:2-polyprenyl-6-hydroxyphenyl methylase/3-demethylubiquinone-9 3-methyltransferase